MPQKLAEAAAKARTAAVVAVFAVLALATVYAVTRVAELLFVAIAAALATWLARRLLDRNRALKAELSEAVAELARVKAELDRVRQRSQILDPREVASAGLSEGNDILTLLRRRPARPIPGEPTSPAPKPAA